MAKRATLSLANQVFAELQNLKSLHAQLVAAGDQELADAVQRSMRELQSPTVSGAAGQVPGATFDVTRP